MIPPRSRDVPPKASAMTEALRGLGYTTGSALADLIDNSISAGATEVSINFFWNGPHSHVSILDNGCGMDEPTLERAMRLGEQNPLETRTSGDLGRFGLGLKTASFSQCRRLTVASTKDVIAHCFRWDLDVLAATQDGSWLLLDGPSSESEPLLRPLNRMQSGTLVLWEILDRIVSPVFSEQNFLDLIDRVETHLALVFHRYLEGPRCRLRIFLNGSPVMPWDPFLPAHPSTWSAPIEKFVTGSGVIEVQSYVLPHKDHISVQEYEKAAGPEGWTSQQGFYVYRNQRLLKAGTWLGLGHGRPWTKEEPYRLARIRLDLPNSADAEWKLDIRKSAARPPVSVRPRLTRLAQDARARARRVFAHRGQINNIPGRRSITKAWKTENFKGGVRYRVDTSHPAVKAVIEQAGDLEPQISAMLRIIEETIPVQRIWLDTAEAKEVPRSGFSGSSDAEILAVLQVMYNNLTKKEGFSADLAREQLLHTEPFHFYPDLVKSLPETSGDQQERTDDIVGR